MNHALKRSDAYQFTFFDRLLFYSIRRFCSDKTHAHFLFKRAFNQRLNLLAPKSFSEKIQWMKIYDRNPLYTQLADKYGVREYVNQRVGNKYLSRLFGVHESVEEIAIDSLPDKFVLKATHGSSMNIICKSKQDLDWVKSKLLLNKWLRINYFKYGREWAYKDILPRIICEEFLVDDQGRIPMDYKLFCFNGVPKFVQVDLDRFGNHTRVFYSTEWKLLPFELLYPAPKCDVARPGKLKEMLAVASSLSNGLSFCRVDLYSLPNIIFGEMTLYPGNGQEQFRPQEYDEIVGSYLKISSDR